MNSGRSVANDTGESESKAVERCEMRRVVLFGAGAAAMCCCAAANPGRRVAWERVGVSGDSLATQ
jgi:hypothetical protein